VEEHHRMDEGRKTLHIRPSASNQIVLNKGVCKEEKT